MNDPVGGPEIGVIIPALNEEDSIAEVVRTLPRVRDTEIIVVDNGSTDATPNRARDAGAIVIAQSERGYGAACLAGIAALSSSVRVVAFIDGDASDDPSELPRLVDPILAGTHDLVIGDRTAGEAEAGSLTATQAFGNRVACTMMRVFFRRRYHDLGPFRAIARDALDRLRMVDRTWGWTVEMQIKAIRRGLRILEVPVSYRCRRTGRSKISGSLVGSTKAGWKIVTTILRHGLLPGERG